MQQILAAPVWACGSLTMAGSWWEISYHSGPYLIPFVGLASLYEHCCSNDYRGYVAIGMCQHQCWCILQDYLQMGPYSTTSTSVKVHAFIQLSIQTSIHGNVNQGARGRHVHTHTHTQLTSSTNCMPPYHLEKHACNECLQQNRHHTHTCRHTMYI